MKKKYCAPVIKAVLFKAEEAVSACVWDPELKIKVAENVTPEEDYRPLNPFRPGDGWAHGRYVGGDDDHWYLIESGDWHIGYKWTKYLITDRPNAS